MDAIRSAGTDAVHLSKGNRAAGRKQVRDVVLDALLLGRCVTLPPQPPSRISLLAEATLASPRVRWRGPQLSSFCVC